MSRDRKVDDVWNQVGFVRSSQYRDDTLCYLFEEGPSMPSEIAEGTDHVLPHVSRALSELREEGVVELLVPEETRRGRIYGLSDVGDRVAQAHLREEDGLRYTVVADGDAEHADLVSFVRESVSEGLQALAFRDGDRVQLVGVDGDVDSFDRYGQLVEAVGGAVDLSVGGDAAFLVSGFPERTVLQLPLDDEVCVGIAVDPDVELAVPTFARECLERIDREE